MTKYKQLINEAINIFVNDFFTEPNYIIIPEVFKFALCDEFDLFWTTDLEKKINKVYGLKIIWYDDIENKEIKCLKG